MANELLVIGRRGLPPPLDVRGRFAADSPHRVVTGAARPRVRQPRNLTSSQNETHPEGFGH
jgi:hypothetical protein